MNNRKQRRRALTTTKPATRKGRRKLSDQYPLRSLVRGRGSFTFNAKRRCFMLNRKPVRGVCSFAKSIAVPAVSAAPDCNGESSRFGGGKARGIKIHNQIKRIIDQRYNPGIKIALHAFVRPILREIAARRWMLVDADVPVWWEETRMGTKVDFVCRTPQGVYVIVELKTGYKGCYTQTLGKMQGMFSGVDYTLHNEHQLQLLSTVILFNKTFPDKTTDNACIFHVEDDSTIHVYELQPWARARTIEVCSAMTKYRYRRTGF